MFLGNDGLYYYYYYYYYYSNNLANKFSCVLNFIVLYFSKYSVWEFDNPEVRGWEASTSLCLTEKALCPVNFALHITFCSSSVSPH